MPCPLRLCRNCLPLKKHIKYLVVCAAQICGFLAFVIWMTSALACFTASAKRMTLLCNRQRQTVRKSGTQSYGPAPGRRWSPSCRTATITKVNSHESLPVMRRVRAGECAVLQVVWHPRCGPFVCISLPIPPVSFSWADSYPLYCPAGAGSSKWCLLLDNRKPIHE